MRRNSLKYLVAIASLLLVGCQASKDVSQEINMPSSTMQEERMIGEVTIEPSTIPAPSEADSVLAKTYEVTPLPTATPATTQPNICKEEQASLRERALAREIVEINNGDYFDLDGDGNLEQIRLESLENNIEKYTLTIGNASVQFRMASSEGRIYLTHMTNGDGIDLQILIDDYGDSGDLCTYVFYYLGGVIYHLGYVEGLVEDIKHIGDGIYETAWERAATLQTWYHPRKFYIADWWNINNFPGEGDVIESPALVQMPKEMYPVGTRVKLKCDISLYQTRLSKLAEIELKKNQYVTLVASDDEEWLYIQNDNRVSGWLLIEEIDDYFEGLCFAD